MGVFLSESPVWKKRSSAACCEATPTPPKPIHLFWVVIQKLIKNHLSDRKKKKTQETDTYNFVASLRFHPETF